MAKPIDLDQLMEYPLRRGSEHCDEKNADPRFLNGVESILEWAQTLPTLTPQNEPRMINADKLAKRIAGHSNYHGDSILAAIYCAAEGQENDAPIRPIETTPNEWVSVEDRLPEYNPGTGAKSYWVAKKDSAGNWQMKIAQYCDYGYAMTVDAETEITWRDWDFTKIVNVTHWMPLPKSPKEDE